MWVKALSYSEYDLLSHGDKSVSLAVLLFWLTKPLLKVTYNDKVEISLELESIDQVYCILWSKMRLFSSWSYVLRTEVDDQYLVSLMFTGTKDIGMIKV